MKNVMLLSGDEALARGAYEEGLVVAASYPGTPASEILEYLSKFEEVDAQWSINEKVAFEVALSASKHVGLNVAMDPLMTSAYTGVGAGFIIVTADDPGIHSSQNEQDNRLIAEVAKIPLLEPSSPSEAKLFVKEAFKISEAFDTPVIIRLTTRIAHTKENVEIGERKEVAQKEFKVDIPKYVMVPKNAYKRRLEIEKRLVRLKEYSENSSLNRIEINDKKIGFITSGVSYLYVKEMYPEASFLKIGFSFPFPEANAIEFFRKVKKVFVIEELEPFLERRLKELGIKFKAKHSSYRIGELRPEYIPNIVNGGEKKEEASITRKPVLCPGCPHRSVFWVLKKIKAVVTGDIGCYTLGALPPLGALHTCLCMGAGITFFEGMKKALHKNVAGVIGDSTFVHTGIPGLINLAYNNTKGLIIILDNSTTAMTGNQPHPATGVTIKGESTKKLILEDICYSCGVDNVDVINPHNVKELEECIKKRINENALSVIIARAVCRLNEKKKDSPPVYKKEDCKRCYLCLSIDCPALTKTKDGLININSELCTGCNLCIETCCFKALTTS
ncbi:MAG: thiamine pyrophosphate-dependent enzyme [Candidatus Omnitrophica bacterium]|nr:thiamine pyrophosphate-dependent enzyme [Candidatus Omnitrophota bacterium]